MAEQQRQSLCPRLIDYLAIVGARSNNFARQGGGQNPVQVIEMLTSIKNQIYIKNNNSILFYHKFLGISVLF